MNNTAKLELDDLLTHREFVRSVAARLLRDGSDVDGVEQLTWITWWKGSKVSRQATRGWLARVARNHSLNLLRGRARAQHREERAGTERMRAAQEEAAGVAERVETARQLVERVLELREPNRTAILLRYYEGQSASLIAVRLGVSTMVVKGRLQRGLAELRAGLAARDPERRELWRGRLSALVAAPLAPAKWYGAVALLQVAGVVAITLGLGTAIWKWTANAVSVPETADSNSVAIVAGATPVGTPTEKLDAADALGVGALESRRRVVAANQGSGKAGEITLGIGDAFVFGEAAARPDGDRKQLDFLVQDIRHGASLACFQGSVEALTLPSSLGLPADPQSACELIESAPPQLPKRDLWLLERCTVERTGLGFIRGLNGRVYKLYLVKLAGHPEALKRRVTIRYEPVPTEAQGGFVVVPTTEGRPADSLLAIVLLASERGAQIPGQTFSKWIEGNYRTADDLLSETALAGGESLLLGEPLASKIVIDTRGAVFAAKGIGREGRVRLESYGAIGCVGTMAGQLRVDSYGYVYLQGNLEGTLELNSYATVYITGDVLGTLKVRSYVDLYLGGLVRGKLDVKGSCWSTFYFDGNYHESDLEEMEGDFGQITLHVRSSSLGVGEHEGIGTWRKVIVGDPVWEGLGK